VHRSPSHLPEKSRAKIAETLNARLADGLDLQSQVKVAHWNVKGPRFPSVHPLFDTFAASLTDSNDAIAERAVTLGGRALGTARHVAKHSGIPEYPQETTQDVQHVELLADRFEKYVANLGESRAVALELSDADTVDLLTQAIRDFEKHAWMLRATLEG